MQTQLKNIINSAKNIYQISENESAYDASVIMCDNKIGSLLINENSILKGIVTERDFLDKVTAKGLDINATKVKDIMTKNLIVVNYRKTALEALQIMTKNKIRHLPVYDDSNTFVGFVSIGDLAKWATNRYLEKKEEVNNLVDYISLGPA